MMHISLPRPSLSCLSLPRLALIGLLLAGASGCASREGTIKNHLMAAGLSEPMAMCMADPLARNLSDDELRSLADLARRAKKDAKQASLADAASALATLGNPHVMDVSLRAITGCALRS